MDAIKFIKLESAAKDKGQRIEVDVVTSAEQTALAISEFYLLMSRVKGFVSQDADEAKHHLEEAVAAEDLQDACRDFVLNRLTIAAVRQIGIDTVLAPGVHAEKHPSSDEDFAFTINLVPRPVLSLSSLEPVQVERNMVEIEETDIDEQVTYTAKQFTSFRKTDRNVLQEGDFGVMDVDILCNGSLRKDLSGMRRTVEVRRGLLPDGFIDGMIGMKVGQMRKFSFDTPATPKTPESDDFDHYTVDVHLGEIREEVVPDITDEWVAQNLPQFENVKGFRSYIRQDLEDQKEKVEQQDLVYQVRAALEKRLEGTIPDEMYQEAKDSLMVATVQKIESQGSSLEQYCEEHNLAKETFNMNVFMQASEHLRQNLALDVLAIAKELKETEEDVQRMKATLPSSISGLSEEDFTERGFSKSLGEQIRRDKALRWLLETATVDLSKTF